MRKLILAPEQRGYSLQEGSSGIVSAILDGGASFYREGYEGTVVRLSLSWVCDGAEYRYMRAFHRVGTAEGALPFLIDLFVDDMDLTQHIARFVPGSWTLDSVEGEAFNVRASIEAQPGVHV